MQLCPSYVVRYDPRGRPVKYNHVAEDEDNNEEEDHGYEYQEQVAHVVDVLDKEFEEVDHPNVGDDDLIDDIDNYSRENDVDDDDIKNENDLMNNFPMHLMAIYMS